MRVNVYAEEMTNRVEIIEKTTPEGSFTGVRFYLELPVTLPHGNEGKGLQTVRGPFMHKPGDDDSAAVTFWGKSDLREVLRTALAQLDAHYAARNQQAPLPIGADHIIVNKEGAVLSRLESAQGEGPRETFWMDESESAAVNYRYAVRYPSADAAASGALMSGGTPRQMIT